MPFILTFSLSDISKFSTNKLFLFYALLPIPLRLIFSLSKLSVSPLFLKKKPNTPNNKTNSTKPQTNTVVILQTRKALSIWGAALPHQAFKTTAAGARALPSQEDAPRAADAVSGVCKVTRRTRRGRQPQQAAQLQN